MSLRHYTAAALVAGTLLLSGCDSAEERAEEHFESGQELAAEGDLDRALVEFRNVFRLNKDHVGARLAFAQIMEDRGNIPEAYANYLRAIEVDQTLIEPRVRLATLAILNQDWTEAQRHAAPVIETAAETADARILDLALQFRDAAQNDREAEVQTLTRDAQALLEEAPDNSILMRVLIEGLSRGGEHEEAISVLDSFISRSPDDLELYNMRLALVSRTQDPQRLEASIRETIEQFPEEQAFKENLIRLLLSEGRTLDAGAFLKAEAEADNTDPAPTLAYLGFLRASEGDEAALAATDDAIARVENNEVLRALKASLLFDSDRREEAITLMEDTIEGVEDAARTDQLRVGLAKMLQATGNQTGARELIDGVLEGDNSNVDALKMKAAWQTEEDRVEDAIQNLRLVLDQSPQDSEAMTLLATAHRRAGNPELSRELLSLAVQTSNNGRTESLRYASLLIDDESWRSAEDVLIQALRRTPNDTDLLRLLGRTYVGSADYDRAAGVEASLRRGDDNAQRAADALNLAILARRDGEGQALNYLEDLAREEGVGRGTRIALLRARLAEGNTDGALAMAEELLAEDPENRNLQLLKANTLFAGQDYDGAESMFREILEADDAPQRAYLQLIRVVSAQGRSDDVPALIDEGLARFENSQELLWAKATDRETRNDIDGAIEIYEELYAQNPNSIILANNLASLLSTYRDDEESLDRAWTVARRLAGTEVGPFMDTYGWLAYRRGEIDTAIEYLAPAAEILEDPIVSYHYARALEADGQTDAALEAFRTALSQAGEEDQRDQIAYARDAVGRLAENADSE